MPKKDDADFPMVDVLDRNGNPTGDKVRSGGEVTAEPQQPGGGPPGRNPTPQNLEPDPDVQDNDPSSKSSQPSKKK